MKIKKFDKKLSLNKKTIATIGNDELDLVKGGYQTGTCPFQCNTAATCSQTGCVTVPTWDCTRWINCTKYCE